MGFTGHIPCRKAQSMFKILKRIPLFQEMGEPEEQTKLLRSFSEYTPDEKNQSSLTSSLTSSTEIQANRTDYVPLSQSTVYTESDTPQNLKVG